jgi:ribosomal protein S17E
VAERTKKQLRNQIAGFITSSLRKEAKTKENLELEGQKSQENIVPET